MNTARFRSLWAAICLVFAALLAGCNRSSPEAKTAAAAKREKPGPEESFKQIMEDFRRKIEDIPIGFVATGANTRSSMIATNKVSYELVPPSGGDNRFKAVVTIVSHIQYSYHRSKPTGEESGEKEQNGSNQRQGQSALNDRKDPTGISIVDPSTRASRQAADANAGSDRKDSAEEVVASRPDEQVRKFELVYENGRWALGAKKPDPKNEKSIQFAFDQALSSQG